jgi:ribonuclease T2
MQTYWKDYQGDDETFWEHEWGKHGTCISTLNLSCYINYQPTQEVVDYFTTTVNLFKTLPSYQWLAAAGITPSSTATYTSAAIQSALQAKHGHPTTIGCKNGALNEIWYHYDVQGSVQIGSFIASDPDGTKSTCPATGVKYLPKPGATTTTATTPTSSAPTSAPTGGALSGNGYLNVINSDLQNGCVISSGKWYTSGTCATFTATPSGKHGGFSLFLHRTDFQV